MNMKKVGDRVRVNVRDAEAWNKTALEALQGHEGVVTEVLVYERATGHLKTKPAALVTFDKPIDKIWKWGSPVTAHWFDMDEIEVRS